MTSVFPPLSDTLVIGIGYKARQGKDTAAQFIIDGFPGRDIHRFGFADALRVLCRVQWGMTTKDGPLLQRVGVAMRAVDPNVWTRALYWAIAERRPEVALITDVRFPNEVDLVRQMGGYVVKINRHYLDGSPFVVSDRDPTHESETALDAFTEWDAVIENLEGCLDVTRGAVLSAFMALALRWEEAA